MLMSADILTALLYFLTGASIMYLFRVRRRTLSLLDHSRLPELTEEDFATLRLLLKTAYERMLYMGVLFIPLAFSTLWGDGTFSTLFFLLLIGLLFLSNIGPRQKIMHLLENNDLSMSDLRKRGFTL
ncbi:hypothetical protein DGMP_28540 [Desulfomarina profundi]|uniref:Uncharacterized protein n=2 Tax=Desulfomarina profundi TaxID=2772557 RepID=A0A8D5FKB5_9BACT|nr:hypothetical protein DGMP_28540 [Desulfomarina profundi]